MYKIKQAAMRAGVSVPVLRAWERRYGIVAPLRTAAGYRLYDDAAVSRVRTMRRMVVEGWSPSTAAEAILSGDAAGEPVPGGGGGEAFPEVVAGERPLDDMPAARRDRDHAIEAFVTAAATFDQAGVEATLDDMFARGSFEQAAGAYVLPAMVALGRAWAAGDVDVAAEHGASHAVLRRLAGAYQAASRSAADGTVLVGLGPGGRHEVGALAFSVAARRAGIPAFYLGPDLPEDEWVHAATSTHARAAVIGVVTGADVEPAHRVVAALHAADPGLLVALGGRAAAEAADTAQASAAAGPDAEWLVRLPDGLEASVDALARRLGRR